MIQDIQQLGKEITNLLYQGCLLSDCQSIVKNYNGSDWKLHIKYDNDRYQRILLWNNSLIDIYLICWKEGQSSPIHDHPDNGCILRVMAGQLEESLYSSNNGLISALSDVPSVYRVDSISFIVGKKGLHSIRPLEDSVTLHIYSPSNYVANTY